MGVSIVAARRLPVDHDPQHHDHHVPAHPSRAEHEMPADHGAHSGHSGHGSHAGHDPDAFRRQFWIVLALTIPVVIWSAEVQEWLGYQAPVFPGSDWIPPVLGTVIFVYGGLGLSEGCRATSCATASPA